MVEFEKAAKKFLHEEGVLRIATVGSDGLPYIAAFSFVFDEEEEAVYLITRAEAKTVQNLKKKPETALLADVYNGNGWKNQFVMIRGTATIIEENPELERVIGMRKKKFPWQELGPIKWAAIRVKPTRVRSWIRARDTLFPEQVPPEYVYKET